MNKTSAGNFIDDSSQIAGGNKITQWALNERNNFDFYKM